MGPRSGGGGEEQGTLGAGPWENLGGRAGALVAGWGVGAFRVGRGRGPWGRVVGEPGRGGAGTAGLRWTSGCGWTSGLGGRRGTESRTKAAGHRRPTPRSKLPGP